MSPSPEPTVAGEPTRGRPPVDPLPTLDRIADALERIAAALERGGPVLAAAPADDRFESMMAVRRALDESRWGLADRLLAEFTARYAGTPHADRLEGEVAEARRGAVADLTAKLEAARQANDPDAAMGFRDDLAPLLRRGDGADFREEVDRPLVRWLLLTIQRRMRTGTVAADVAALAGRVAERFGDTPEGAGLRASLPTLRRSAGLCPRCAEPFTGTAPACPRCLASAAVAPSEGAPAPTAAAPEDPPDAPDVDETSPDPDPFRDFD